MVAPQGRGRYARAQIVDILTTAVTGFEAAAASSPAGTASEEVHGLSRARLDREAVQHVAARVAAVEAKAQALSFCARPVDRQSWPSMPSTGVPGSLTAFVRIYSTVPVSGPTNASAYAPKVLLEPRRRRPSSPTLNRPSRSVPQ